MIDEFDFNSELIAKMRSLGREGKSVREIVESIYTAEKSITPLYICIYFIKAYNLSFTQVKYLQGASYVDGALPDDLIEDTVGCAVRSGKY